MRAVPDRKQTMKFENKMNDSMTIYKQKATEKEKVLQFFEIPNEKNEVIKSFYFQKSEMNYAREKPS